MKKSLGLKICAGIAVVSALAFLPLKASAINTNLIVGDDSEFFKGGPNGSHSNAEGTATYKADEKLLILDGYSGGIISTDIDSLTISVVKDSRITGVSTTSSSNAISINSTGSVTITVNKGVKLTVDNGIKTSGKFTLSSGNIDLGTSDLTVLNGDIKISGGIKAGSIVLNDTDKTSQAKITIDDGAVIDVAKSIKANYSFAATEKGIVLGNKICSNPAAEVENVNSTSTSKSTTSTFTTSTLTTGVTTGIKLSASVCEGGDVVDEDGNLVENPDTLDMIYVYAALLVASSAILGYRRYIAKR